MCGNANNENNVLPLGEQKIEKINSRTIIGRMTDIGEGIVTKNSGQAISKIGCMVERREWKWQKGS